MKYSAAATLLALQVQNTAAFAPSSFARVSVSTTSTQRSAFVDPSIFTDAHQHADALSSIFSSINLADATDAVDAVADVATSTTAAVADVVTTAAAAAPAAADAVAEVAKDDNGWFGFLEGPIEFLLGTIHSALVGIGMDENAWGITIIAMTSLIKLATYPLTAQQLKGTNKMQVSQYFFIFRHVSLYGIAFVRNFVFYFGISLKLIGGNLNLLETNFWKDPFGRWNNERAHSFILVMVVAMRKNPLAQK